MLGLATGCFDSRRAAEGDCGAFGELCPVPVDSGLVESITSTWLLELDPLVKESGPLVFGRGENPINFVSVEEVAALDFIRLSSIGLSAAAPTTDTSTNSAPATSAASMSRMFPSRSTDAGVTPPEPTKPCMAEITVSMPRIATARLAGSRTSPLINST